MKRIFLPLSVLVSALSFSQQNCADAIAITTNSTIITPALTGTYYDNCVNPNEDTFSAAWYSYTATADGIITVSSNLAVNDGFTNSDDTRLSIFSGSCGALTCEGGNDDIDNSNYLSEKTIAVTSGTTYYIQWDDYNTPQGFQWTLNFQATSCLPTGAAEVTGVTTNSFSATWPAATGTFTGYNIEYGPVNFTPGTGTVINTPTNNITVGSLTPGTTYEYYVRTDCGTSQSIWTGPEMATTAFDLPYTNTLDTFPANAYGWQSDSWEIGTNSASAQSGNNYVYNLSSPGAANNDQLYSSALNLPVNYNINLKFFTQISDAGYSRNLKVYYSTSQSMTGAVQVGNFTVSNLAYEEKNVNFTVPSSGIYYLIFSDESGATNFPNTLRLDTFSVTASSVLATTENNGSVSDLTVYPNPATEFLSISTAQKVNSAEIYDMSGKRVNTKLKDKTVDVRNLRTGTYIIRIETDKESVSKKFIKK